MELIILLFGLVIAAFFLFSVFTKEGRGKSLGGAIVETMDDTLELRDGLVKTKIKVHLLSVDGETENLVSLDISRSTFASYNLSVANLNKDQALRLITMLQSALK